MEKLDWQERVTINPMWKLWTTTKGKTMTAQKMPPIHAGEILQELFLYPAGISPYRLAKDTGLSPTRISQILKGKRGISAETALRFSRYFGNSPEYWLGIQAQYDLAKAEDERIDAEVRPLQATG